MKKVKCWTEPWDGKIGLWMDWGTGRWNVGDLPKEHITPHVLGAIMRAFECGAVAVSQSITSLPGFELPTVKE